MKRKICVVVTARPSYARIKTALQAIRDHPDLELQLIVTGAHLSPLHGETVRDIEADGFPIAARIDNLLYSDRDAARLKGAASQLQVLAHVVDEMRPDWLLVPTDREEAITLALCGAYLGIPMAHYGAGDRVVGNVDDMMRHAVSRLAHLLFTSHEEARQRLIKGGEEEWRVHNVGLGGLDRIRETPEMTASELAPALSVKQIEKPYVVVVQHPLSSEWTKAGAQMRETLEAVVELGFTAFITYPNSDPGSNQIIEVIEEFASSHESIHAFKNIPDPLFINLLRGAALLLGNSSLGLMEAPFLHLPVINVGRRQSARFHAENVFFIDHDKDAIVKQARLILEDPATQARVRNCSNPFGEGRTGERIAQLLAETEIDRRLLDKDLTY